MFLQFRMMIVYAKLMNTTLSYAPVPSGGRAAARVVRFAMLGIAIACFGVGVTLVMGMNLWKGEQVPAWYATPIAPANFGDEHSGPWYAITSEITYYIWASVLIGAFLLGQWLFLLPRGQWRIDLTQNPRPMKRAAIVAGAIAMLLMVGLAAALLDFGDYWQTWTAVDQDKGHSGQDFRIVWMVMAVLWAAWGIFFYRYFRSASDGYTAFTRVFRGLVSGTVLELLVAGPVHAFHTSKDDCYCAKGSYTGLVFGCTAAVWLFGPGVFLLFLRESHRCGQILDQAKVE
jgi:hypothetical protein